jgi:hypothetical protein
VARTIFELFSRSGVKVSELVLRGQLEADGKQQKGMKMKKIAMVSTLLCALAFVAGPSVARAIDDKKPCCEATVEAGKKCEHKCCQKAAEEGKVCEKCHPKKDEKK